MASLRSVAIDVAQLANQITQMHDDLAIVSYNLAPLVGGSAKIAEARDHVEVTMRNLMQIRTSIQSVSMDAESVENNSKNLVSLLAELTGVEFGIRDPDVKDEFDRDPTPGTW